MRGLSCRGLRLDLIAGLGIALMMPALAVSAQSARALATQTALTAETRDQGGSTQASVAVTVTGEDGLPVTGAVTIRDQGRQLAGAALDAQGKARLVLDLAGGDHLLTAEYAGDATHLASTSDTARVNAMAPSGPPDFQISVAPGTLTLTPGDAGTIVVTVTPVNNAALTAPMFVALSCSGLPDQATCNFTPQRAEILSSTPASCASGSPASACPPTSTMMIETVAASTTAASPVKGCTPIAWAFLLPGALGLGGLVARRRWLSRLALVCLAGLVTLLGTTGCNPRYNYEHHGPIANPPTPAGTYTVTVTGQSTNGVTATLHSTSFVLTVK